MAKRKKPKYQGIRKPLNRSDIPYAERLMVNKFATIAEHRDNAGLIALKIDMATLNDTEGMGYTRLVRFAKHQQDLTSVFYTDPEFQEAKLDERLTGMGFTVEDGRLISDIDENGNTVRTRKWRPANMGDLQLRPCPFCGAKPRVETMDDVCTRLRCSNSVCYVHHNPWTSWHNGDTEAHAVQRLAVWWNGGAYHGTK